MSIKDRSLTCIMHGDFGSHMLTGASEPLFRLVNHLSEYCSFLTLKGTCRYAHLRCQGPCWDANARQGMKDLGEKSRALRGPKPGFPIPAMLSTFYLSYSESETSI